MSPFLIMGLIGGVLLIVGAGVALIGGGRQTEMDQRLEEFVSGAGTLVMPEYDLPQEKENKRSLRDSIGEALDGLLAGRGMGDRVRERIAKADMKLRIVEYIGFQIVAAGVVGGVAYYFMNNNIYFAGLGAFIGLRIPRIYTGMRASRRMRTFDGQLSDTLNLWVNSLRSGYSVLQGLEAIATELPPPVSTEFERVVQEVRLGISLQEALNNMLRRMPSEDLDLVVTAVNIQREVGGNLAEILSIISHTIRERVRIKGEIRTLTAQGRASGWVVGLLPVGLALILYKINPGYMSEMWVREKPFVLTVPCGWFVIATGIAMIVGGVFAIQKIVDIEV